MHTGGIIRSLKKKVMARGEITLCYPLMYDSFINRGIGLFWFSEKGKTGVFALPC